MSPGPPLSFMVHNMDTYPQPPPAHMGSHIDKGKEKFKKRKHEDPRANDNESASPYPFNTVIPRPSLYPLGGPNQYPHVFPDLAQWHSPAMYQIPTSGFRGSVPYPTSLSGPPATSNFVRSFGQSLIPPYPPIGSHSGLSHPALMKHSSHTHDLMAAVAAASVGLNQQGHLDGRGGPAGSLHHQHQSYPGHGSNHVPSVSPHLTSMLASSAANLDQKPHHSLHTSSLISRMSNGRGVSPSDSSVKSNSSPPSSECKSKVSNGPITLNNNRIGHVNHNRSHNDTPDSMLGTSHSANSSSSNNNNHNNSSSSNHNGAASAGGNSTCSSNSNSSSNNNNNNNNANAHGHVKKPLNAFMLYMKEQRPLVVQEFTLKESAQINQILGKKVITITLHCPLANGSSPSSLSLSLSFSFSYPALIVSLSPLLFSPLPSHVTHQQTTNNTTQLSSHTTVAQSESRRSAKIL